MVSSLVKKKIIPIIIGGSQDLTYAMYRAYDVLEQMVNLVSIDSKFDLGKENATDEELEDLFDYTPEELARLRILAKYIGGIDREAAFREFSKML